MPLTRAKPYEREFGPHKSLAPDLWDGVAFVLPLASPGYTRMQGLLNGYGQPLEDSSLTAGSTLKWRETPYGLGVGISGASNLLQQDNIEFITTSNGAGTGDFTMVVLANPISESRISWGLAQGNAANGTNTWLGFNSGASLTTATAGTFVFGTRNNTDQGGASTPSAIDGNYHLFAGSRTVSGGNETARAWVDGVLRTTAAAEAVKDIATGALGFAIGQRPEDTTFRIATTTNIIFAAAWNRALRNAEMRLLALDPFIMFRWRGRQQSYYIPAAGGDVRKKIIPAYMRIAA